MAEIENTGSGDWSRQTVDLLRRGGLHYQAMPPRRRRSLATGSLLLLAVMVSVGWFLERPDWRSLYTGLEARDAGTIVQELGAAGIEFRVTPDQTGIEVPAEMLNKARMEIAAKGMPPSGRLGFELFDKPNWVGSEFDEKVNYQRALEGELEHTIATLSAVKAARVHLVLPEQSLFSRQEQPAKASVVLRLKRMTMDADQADTIRRVVAGAVANLSPEDVTLMDADGKADLAARGLHSHQGDAEQALEAKLVAMLEPVAGTGNVRAIVNAVWDEGSEERTDEVYDPASVVTLSMQKTEQSSGPAAGGGGGKASGVPGTASNTPAAAAAGAVQGSSAAAAPGTPPLLQAPGKDPLPVYPNGGGGGGGQVMHQESGTYGVTKRTLHREDAPGRLRRLTVAVLVNDRQASEGVWKPRGAEEMHRLETLADAAVGFDPKRGDQVTLENISFTSNLPRAVPTGMAKVADTTQGLLHAEPGALRSVVLGLVAAMTVLLVVKPISKQVIATLKEPLSLGAGSSGRFALGGDSISASLSGGTSGEKLETLNPMVIEEVSEFIRKKPALSTRLLESWIEGAKDVS